MDGVSVASGIAGLITLAIQLTGTIQEYAVAVKNKSADIEELQSELVLLSENLNNLREILEDEKLKGRSFDADSVLWKAIQDCRTRIERIGDSLLPKIGGRLDRALDRLKWPFQQKEVLTMIDNLRRFSQIFQFAVNIENCKLLASTYSQVEKTLKEVLTASRKVSELQLQYGMNADEAIKRATEVEQALNLLPMLEETLTEIKDISHGVRLAELQERERRKTEILDWLSPISSLTKHRDVQAKRAEGTGTRLLGHKEVVAFTSHKSQFQHILCVGGPGTGKTVTSSLIVDHIRGLYKDADSVVAYYYCTWDEEQSQIPLHFACALLRQLCSRLDFIPTSVTEFFRKTRNEIKDQTWFLELQEVLRRVIKTYTTCFIVIDALDELPLEQRTKVLQIVRKITDAVQHSSSVRVFATSRPHVVISQINFKIIEIAADDHDLRTLILSKIKEHPDRGHILDAPLVQQITDKLCLNADGMFLLPALQIEQLLNNDTKAAVRQQLEHLSTNLNDLYTATIRRIRAQPQGRQDIARRTLIWLSTAKRQLKVPQLLHALAIRLEDAVPNMDRDNILLPRTVLDSCCGLVIIEADSSIIKFHHFSVEEFIRSYASHGLFDADECELLISRTLLTYMSLPELEQSRSKNRQAFEQLLVDLPLLDYCAFNWGNHVRNVRVQDIEDLALPFLNSRKHMIAISRAQSAKGPDFRKWYEKLLAWAHSGGAGVSLASAFGLDDLIRVLLEESQQNTSAKNVYGSGPLHETAICGFESTAQLLIGYGANVLDQNSGKLTPFYLATSFNHVHLVKSLIKHDTRQLALPNHEGWTPLHKACDSGLTEMVGVLLDLGADINAQDYKCLTPLHLASRKGHFEVVQVLTNTGANLHATDGKRLTPLDFATISGHVETVQWFLDHGSKVNHRADDGWTSLHRAARGGHKDAVLLLLNRGAEVLTQDYKGNIPLFSAVRSGSLEVVAVLLNHNPDLRKTQIFHRDKRGEMARIVAFYTAHPDISKFLRVAELDYIPADNAPANRLTRAIEQHDLIAVEEILNQSPTSIDQPDSDGQPPLHVAIQEQSFPIAIFLIGNGASIESLGYHGWRPLQIAASLGNLELVRLCLNHNANVFFMSSTGQTALHKACSANSVEVVQLLLQHGADPHISNNRNMTPLHIAAAHNQLDIARCLISEYHVDVSVLDKTGDSPSKWASRSGHYEMLEYLREEEKRVKAEKRIREKERKRFAKAREGEGASAGAARLDTKKTLLVMEADEDAEGRGEER